MKVRLAPFVVTACVLSTGACKKEKPWEIHGYAPGSMDPPTAVVNGVEVKAKDRISYANLPAGTEPASIKTFLFRYQTPCGTHDVPNTVAPVTNSMKVQRYIEADPTSKDGYLWEHVVLVDPNGADPDKLDIKVGKQALGTSHSSEPKTTDAWRKVRMGKIFGPECGGEHEVTVDGKVVGKLPARVADDFALDESNKRSVPVFITAKAACYRLHLRAVDTKTSSGGTLNRGDSYDSVFRGPGAFYLPLMPDVLGKDPDDPAFPAGLFEVPCEAPAAPAAP